MAKLANLALQLLDPISFCARQAGPLASIAFGTLTPAPLAVRRAAKLRGNRSIRSIIAGIFAAMFSEKPNAALAELDWVGRGVRA